MKTLKGLEELKYMALYNEFMYEHTGNSDYWFALDSIIDKILDDYGLVALIEVLGFIQGETERLL